MIDQMDIINMLMDFSKVRGPSNSRAPISFSISDGISMSIRGVDITSYDTTFIPPEMRLATTDLVGMLPHLEGVYHGEGYRREYRHRRIRELLQDTGFDETEVEGAEFQTLLRIRYPDIG